MKEPWEMTLDESYRYWHYNFNRLYYEAKAIPGFEEAEVKALPFGEADKIVRYGNHYFFLEKLSWVLEAKLAEFEAFWKLCDSYTNPNFHYDLVKEAIKEGKPVPKKVIEEFEAHNLLLIPR